MHLTQNKTHFQDSINSIFCVRTLAITRTNSLALADKKYSTRFSRVDELFFALDLYSVYFTSHPFCSLFLLFTSLNLQCLDHCSFPTPLLCFCLRSSFSKSPALHSTSSKDTCGECVHSHACVRFMKGKAAEWNCSFLNNWGDGATGRQKGDEGSGSWWREKILTFSVHLWIIESMIDGRFQGSFQKAEMFEGWIGCIKYCLTKQQKAEEKKMEFLFRVWANNTSPKCTKY